MSTPEVIGRYEIIEELGRGAMGSVFKARDPAVGRIVALKTIHSTALEGAQSEEYRARFYREARASGVLAHPGIVPVFDVGEHQGAPFLVMEFVDGRTLAAAIKKGERLPVDRVCEIGQQLGEALGYAHRQGVIHRDIKPANILLTSRQVYGSERPRITDFGIAKLAASEITTTGQLLGTPSFMPPEQFTGAPTDGRADLFSLGVILYSLATGEQPFPGETMTTVSYKVVHTDPIPPARLNPGVPARLEAVILKCLAKNPAERYQTGEEIAQDLLAIRTNPGAGAAQPMAAAMLAGASDATLGPAAAVPAKAQKSKAAAPRSAANAAKKPGKPRPFETVFAVGLLAVAGLAAVAAGGWFYFQQRRTQPTHAPLQAAAAPVPRPQATPQPAAEPETADSTGQDSTGRAQPPSAAPREKPQATAQAKPANVKPSLAQLPALKPAPGLPAATTTTVATAVPPPAIAITAPAPHPAAVVTFDPRRLDPTTSSRLKIDMSHFPIGVPYTVEMNGKVYLRGITGENVDLNDLFVPPGVQEFRISMKSGGQQKVSNIVSEEFKAKKRKTLKVELRGDTGAGATSAEPISGGAQIYVLLK